MKLILDRPLLDKRRTFCNSGILDETDEVEDDRHTRAQLKTPPSHDAYPRGGGPEGDELPPDDVGRDRQPTDVRPGEE